MNLEKNMKLTQLHSFPDIYSQADDFTKQNWEVTNITSKGKQKFYIVKNVEKGSVIMMDEEAIRSFFTNWTPWKKIAITYKDKEYYIRFRTNYRIVEVVYGQSFGKATCHKLDSFNLHQGILLAFERALEKSKMRKFAENIHHSIVKEHCNKKTNKNFSQQTDTKELLNRLRDAAEELIRVQKKKEKLSQKNIQNTIINCPMHKDVSKLNCKPKNDSGLLLKQKTNSLKNKKDNNNAQTSLNNIDILKVPCYYSVIHFTTYKPIPESLELDNYFNVFGIENGIKQEREWQENLSSFLVDETLEDMDIMTSYGKNIITVFVSNDQLFKTFSIESQKIIAKGLIKALQEANIHYIALWVKECPNTFYNILTSEAIKNNYKLNIIMAI